jgi:hypothetical protein
VLRQAIVGVGRGRLRLLLWLWLRHDGGRGRLHDGATGARLRDGLWRWNRLNARSRGDCDTTGDNRGGGNAETCPCDEITSGDDRSSAFANFSGLCSNRLGWLLTC